MQPPNDPLDSLLERWRQATPNPPDRLEQEVWRRVAADEIRPDPKPGIFARIEAVFARAAFTATFVTACMLLGLFLAERRVSHQQAQRTVQVVQSYLRLVDPMLDAQAEGDALPDLEP
jgi:hypothetical protein